MSLSCTCDWSSVKYSSVHEIQSSRHQKAQNDPSQLLDIAGVQIGSCSSLGSAGNWWTCWSFLPCEWMRGVWNEAGPNYWLKTLKWFLCSQLALIMFMCECRIVLLVELVLWLMQANSEDLKSQFAPEKSNSEEIRARAKCLVITNVKRDEKNYFLVYINGFSAFF